MKPHLDPYQFAHKHNRSTKDTTLTLLYNAYYIYTLILKNQVHLSKFSSSTFLLPSVPYCEKYTTIPQAKQTFKNQCLKPKIGLSTFLSCSISTSSPQGTVLSPLLFTTNTNDCTGTDTTPVIKYSGDSAIEDLSNSDSVYFAEVERFSNWCRD